MDEQKLEGGRVTQGVARRGDEVLRPLNANSARVHAVLDHLEHKGMNCAPRFLGIEGGRERLSFLPGEVPDNLGDFSDAQIMAAARIIRKLHAALCDFPGLDAGQTICHNDLSPCNFAFFDGIPRAVIDWDACAPGDAEDDLAYAMWMWLDVGNREIPSEAIHRRARLMLEAYELPNYKDIGMDARIVKQMQRVADSIFKAEEQTLATRNWALSCAKWVRENGVIG